MFGLARWYSHRSPMSKKRLLENRFIGKYAKHILAIGATVDAHPFKVSWNCHRISIGLMWK